MCNNILTNSYNMLRFIFPWHWKHSHTTAIFCCKSTNKVRINYYFIYSSTPSGSFLPVLMLATANTILFISQSVNGHVLYSMSTLFSKGSFHKTITDTYSIPVCFSWFPVLFNSHDIHKVLFKRFKYWFISHFFQCIIWGVLVSS